MCGRIRSIESTDLSCSRSISFCMKFRHHQETSQILYCLFNIIQPSCCQQLSSSFLCACMCQHYIRMTGCGATHFYTLFNHIPIYFHLQYLQNDKYLSFVSKRIYHFLSSIIHTYTNSQPPTLLFNATCLLENQTRKTKSV